MSCGGWACFSRCSYLLLPCGSLTSEHSASQNQSLYFRDLGTSECLRIWNGNAQLLWTSP